MRALILAASVILAGILLACPPRSLPKPVPPSDQVPSYEPPPSGPPARPTGFPAGATCNIGAECASRVCEGEGCGSKAGTCAPSQRACTFDAQPYCGCDGTTFTTSGSCPGRRYLHRGACNAGAGSGSAAGPLPAGASCLAGAECESGVCEGEGCGAGAPGTCAPRARACTRDHRTYCGCDGVTFHGSGSCPGRRFASRGACPK